MKGEFIKYRLRTALLVGPLLSAAAGLAARNWTPVGLDAYCPVTVIHEWRWVKGNPRFSATHEGHPYWFATEAAYRVFQTAPEQYAPVLAGCDPVSWVRHRVRIAGSRKYAVRYGQRTWLFANEVNLQTFLTAPNTLRVMLCTKPSGQKPVCP